jgi:hypothetical protein
MSSYFEVIGAENEPSAKGESGVDEQGTKQEAEDRREGFLKSDNEHVVRAEETQVAQNSEPDEKVSGAQQKAAHVPQIRFNVFVLHQLLDDGASHQQDVVDDDQHVPQVEEFQLVVFTQMPPKVPHEKIVRLLLPGNKGRLNIFL